jgi:hypothetical protein
MKTAQTCPWSVSAVGNSTAINLRPLQMTTLYLDADDTDETKAIQQSHMQEDIITNQNMLLQTTPGGLESRTNITQHSL